MIFTVKMQIKIGVQIVSFYVAFEENVYKKEGAEIEVRHFYKEMVENPTVFPKTSMPSVQDYVEFLHRS